MFTSTPSEVLTDICDLLAYGLTDEEIVVYLTNDLPEIAALQIVTAMRLWGLVPISYNN